MPQPKNLGRVWAKVELYDRLPNIINDPNKLRQARAYVASVDGGVTLQQDSFGVNLLVVPNEKTGKVQSSAIIPKICYEPVNNYMLAEGADKDATAIYWEKIGDTGTGGIPPLFKRLIIDNNKMVNESTSLPINTNNPQKWGNAVRNVPFSGYNEADFKRSGLNFDSDFPFVS